MLVRHPENPVEQFARSHRATFDQARSDLLTLSGLDADFIFDGLAALAKKDDTERAPSLGRFLPFLIADGLELQAAERRRLAAAWVAVYGYVILVDQCLDKAGALKGRALMSASALLGWGLSVMAQTTAGTHFAHPFLRNIAQAFNGQYADLGARNGGLRRISDIDKNRALVAMTAGYAAAGGESDDRLLLAVEKLLGPLQMLDDLLDVEEDLEEGNATVFVQMLRRVRSEAVSGVEDRRALYARLFSAPEFPGLLEEARSALEEATLLLEGRTDNALAHYFVYLRGELGSLIDLVRQRQREGVLDDPDLYERVHLIICGT